MSRFLLPPLLLLIACTSQTTPASEVAETSPITIPQSTAVETVQSLPDDSLSPHTTVIAPDSSVYIGEVSTFRETGELYTPVYFHPNVVTDGLFDALEKQTDSVIYEDIEIGRSRVPESVARNYFNLSGLDTISVYEDARHAGNARFVRVEYFQDVIESKFIAVFKPLGASTLPQQPDYCISKGQHPYKTIPVTSEEIEDEQLTKMLLEKFVPGTERVWDVSHTRIMPHHSVYSAISMQSRLLLVETHDGQSRILKDLEEDWFISEITPLHLESNGKPILLLWMGVNETDILWHAVAIYSGKGFVFAEGNRVGGL